jgi:hypothetical protein
MNSTKIMTNLAEPSLNPTKLAAIGMDQRQRNALRMLFTSRCHNRYVLTQEASSEICILDLDTFGGKQQWQEFRERHPDWPLILVSVKHHDMTDPYTLFVKKPIPVERLITAIEIHRRNLSTINTNTKSRIENSLDEQITTPHQETVIGKKLDSPHRAASLMSASQEQVFVGTSPEIDPQDPLLAKKIYYNPEHYLQNLVQQALNQAVRYNQNLKIEGHDQTSPWTSSTTGYGYRRMTNSYAPTAPCPIPHWR